MVIAENVHLINSEDWVDVYSGMLKAGLQGERGFFINSETVTSLTGAISKDDIIHLYQSKDNPYIPNLGSQLESLGYHVVQKAVLSNLNQDLNPKTGNYYLVSLDNPRITSSLAPLAVKENAWVFIVDVENVDSVVDQLKNAKKVVTVGKFPRDVLTKIKPYVTEQILTDDLYADSRVLADKFANTENYVLTDGAFIEAEFFSTKNPVLLSGPNKILTQTYNYLESKNAKAVILVGNELSVVGEQIRTKSNQEISVFVKFGQGDTTNSGTVYALTTFPLPSQRYGLQVQQAIYDPVREELIVTFKNTGNVGVYELTNLQVLNDGDDLGTTAANKIIYLSAGELLPVKFSINLELGKLTGATVDFYTSFGLSLNELDHYMTSEGKYMPPMTMPLTVKEIDNDDSILYVEDVAYYKNMNRVAITVTNPGEQKVYLTAKVHDLIINGLEKTLSTNNYVKAGETKKVYLPAKLDSVDLEDNEFFDVVLNYGKAEDFQFKAVSVRQPFKVVSGGRITGFVTGLGDGSSGSWIALIVIALLLLVVARLLTYKKSKEAIMKLVSRPKKVKKSKK